MRDMDFLRLEADAAFQELLGSIDEVSQHQAWAQAECAPGEYLHTGGSILSIVVHIAGGKLLYGSAAYKDLEVRWRDTVAREAGLWPSWEEAKRYLHEAQAYWLASWAEEEDPERLVARFDGQMWPSWKIISTVSHHDSYHAGQIHLLRSILPPSQIPPPEESELNRQACEPLPSW